MAPSRAATAAHGRPRRRATHPRRAHRGDPRAHPRRHVECIAELGFQRTTAQEITRRAGVTWGAVQHHFGDKDGILLARARGLVPALRRAARRRSARGHEPRRARSALPRARLAALREPRVRLDLRDPARPPAPDRPRAGAAEHLAGAHVPGLRRVWRRVFQRRAGPARASPRCSSTTPCRCSRASPPPFSSKVRALPCVPESWGSSRRPFSERCKREARAASRRRAKAAAERSECG